MDTFRTFLESQNLNWFVLAPRGNQLNFISGHATEEEARAAARELIASGQRQFLILAERWISRYNIANPIPRASIRGFAYVNGKAARGNKFKVKFDVPLNTSAGTYRFVEKIADLGIDAGNLRELLHNPSDAIQSAIGYGTKEITHTNKWFVMIYNGSWNCAEHDGRIAYFHDPIIDDDQSLGGIRNRGGNFLATLRRTNPIVAVVHVDSAEQWSWTHYCIQVQARTQANDGPTIPIRVRHFDRGVMSSGFGEPYNDVAKINPNNFVPVAFLDRAIDLDYPQWSTHPDLRIYHMGSQAIYSAVGEDIVRAFDDEEERLVPRSGG